MALAPVVLGKHDVIHVTMHVMIHVIMHVMIHVTMHVMIHVTMHVMIHVMIETTAPTVCWSHVGKGNPNTPLGVKQNLSNDMSATISGVAVVGVVVPVPAVGPCVPLDAPPSLCFSLHCQSPSTCIS